MGIWTNKDHRTLWDDADDFGNAPSGGRLKQWLAGVLLPIFPTILGVHGLVTGTATLFGTRGGSMDLSGSSAIALSTAYLAFATFFHFHYFWGLKSDRDSLSRGGKLTSLIVLLPCLLYVIWQVLDLKSWLQ